MAYSLHQKKRPSQADANQIENVTHQKRQRLYDPSSTKLRTNHSDSNWKGENSPRGNQLEEIPLQPKQQTKSSRDEKFKYPFITTFLRWVKNLTWFFFFFLNEKRSAASKRATGNGDILVESLAERLDFSGASHVPESTTHCAAR